MVLVNEYSKSICEQITEIGGKVDYDFVLVGNGSYIP